MAIQGPRFSRSINSLWVMIQGGFQRTAGANLMGSQLIQQGIPRSKLWTAPDRNNNNDWALYAADSATYSKAQKILSSGGGGSGGGGATGQVAANASLKQFTGGGFQNVGATNIQNAGVAVVGEFLGVNFQTAPTKLPEGQSPDAQNVDGMARGGALSPRPGLIALWPKRNDTSTTIADAYKGRSINILSPAMSQSLHMTVVTGYDRTSTVGASLASTTYTQVKKMKPLWHPQRDISRIAPTIRLTDSTASTGVTLSIYMPAKFRRAAPQVSSVDQLIVRVSGTTYPRDRDGKDDTNSRLVSSNDYVTWDGTSNTASDNGGSSVSTGATLYYSAWGVSKLHVSQRASLKVEVK